MPLRCAGGPGLANDFVPGSSCSGLPVFSGAIDARGLIRFPPLPRATNSVLEESQAEREPLSRTCKPVNLFGLDLLPATSGVPASAASQTLPPACQDTFPSGGQLLLELTSVGLFEFSVNSPATVQRQNPGDREGDGLTDVQTEIVALELVASNPFPILIRESPSRSPTGLIEQQSAAHAFPANSFFGVFAEIDTPLGTRTTAIQSAWKRRSIPSPTLEFYCSPETGSIALCDPAKNQAGISLHAFRLPLPVGSTMVGFVNQQLPSRPRHRHLHLRLHPLPRRRLLQHPKTAASTSRHWGAPLPHA